MHMLNHQTAVSRQKILKGMLGADIPESIQSIRHVAFRDIEGRSEMCPNSYRQPLRTTHQLSQCLCSRPLLLLNHQIPVCLQGIEWLLHVPLQEGQENKLQPGEYQQAQQSARPGKVSASSWAPKWEEEG